MKNEKGETIEWTEIRWDPPKENHEHEWIEVWEPAGIWDTPKIICMAIWCDAEKED